MASVDRHIIDCQYCIRTVKQLYIIMANLQYDNNKYKQEMDEDDSSQSIHYFLQNLIQSPKIAEQHPLFVENIKKIMEELKTLKVQYKKIFQQKTDLLKLNKCLHTKIEKITQELRDSRNNLSISKTLSLKQQSQRQNSIQTSQKEMLRKLYQQSQQKYHNLQHQYADNEKFQNSLQQNVLRISMDQNFIKFKEILARSNSQSNQSISSNQKHQTRSIQFDIRPKKEIKTFSALQSKRKLEIIQKSVEQISLIWSQSAISLENLRAEVDQLKRMNQNLKKQLQEEKKNSKQFEKLANFRKEKSQQSSQISIKSLSLSEKDQYSTEYLKMLIIAWKKKYQKLEKKRQNQLSLLRQVSQRQ